MERSPHTSDLADETVALQPEEAPNDVILQVRNATKIYPGTTALDDVSFNVYRGKVNVLVGENGAGKSTLMKIIAGAEQPTEGQIILEGEEISIASVKQASDKGIGIVFQELNLCANLNVTENIFLGQERVKNGHVDQTYQREIAQRLMDRLEQDINPDTLVAELRIGQQQIVEIAKAISKNVKVLIMDEPTSALSSVEVEVLFRLIEELKSQNVSIIYISHRLEELVAIGDYITVLRDGKFIEEAPMAEINVPWIVQAMVGSASRENHHVVKEAKEVVLEVEDLCLLHESGTYTVDNVNLTLRAGEIVGIYGLMGAGRSELFDCLIGLETAASGAVSVSQQDLGGLDVSERIRSGLSLIPEDRQRQGLVQVLSISNNMTLASLWKYLKGFHIKGALERRGIVDMIRDLSIKVASPDNPITSLSGGNQQKVVIGKALLTSPKVLLMDEPTRGIDVGAKGEVFDTMNTLAQKGMGILFVTSDLNEIMSVSDRMLVMSNGKITGKFTRQEATEEALVAASAIGHKTKSSSELQQEGI